MEPTTERKRMNFDKTIISNALTILAMFGGLTVTYAQFSARVSVLESELVRQRETDKRHEAEAELLKREIREELRDIKDDLRRAADAVERRNRAPRDQQ
jgi:hypothetical protein